LQTLDSAFHYRPGQV